jgi:hypothetical protein
MKFKQGGFVTEQKQKRRKRNRPRVAEAMGEKVLASGTITLPPGSIPSPSEGKSTAFDFAQALMEGNPTALAALNKMDEGHDGLVKPSTMAALDAIETVHGKPEDEASLADKFVASTYSWCKYFGYTSKEEKLVTPLIMAYRHAMRHANKFVLDKEFTEYATHVSNRSTPEKVLARLPLCTLPYETTWIEFDLLAKVRAMRTFHGLSPLPETGTVANRMGVLLERVSDTMSTVTLVCEGEPWTTPNLTGYVFSTDETTFLANQTFHGMTPFAAAYRVDKLRGMPAFRDVMNEPDSADIMHRVAHGTMWGFSATSGVIDNSTDFIKNIRTPEFLRRHGELAFSRFYDFFEMAGRTNQQIMTATGKLISDEIAEFTGMMRWLVAVLAMLNEVPTRANFIQPSHTMRHGLTKRGAAFDFHRLTLRLPKVKPIPFLERHLSNVERKHKAHKVRQHWRTYLHVDQQCLPEEHAWEYDNEHGYALCGKCMAFRRRIPEHVRGDPSLGWVHKDYLIKPADQDQE